MIRGIALLLLATATSARSQVNVVHVPRVEVPELDVEVPDVSLAMAGEDESDDGRRTPQWLVQWAGQ